MNEITFNVVEIVRGTTVDGPGFRTAIYLAGCSHHCPECHNPQTWDPNVGKKMNLCQIMDVVKEEDFDVTLSGGDPLYHPLNTYHLVDALKKNGRNVWIYTGYSWEEIIKKEDLTKAVSKADVLVDGLFISTLKDPDMPFRGSSNQRIIDIQESLNRGTPILYKKKI